MTYATAWVIGSAAVVAVTARQPFAMAAAGLALVAMLLEIAQPPELRRRTAGLTLILLIVAISALAPRLARLL